MHASTRMIDSQPNKHGYSTRMEHRVPWWCLPPPLRSPNNHFLNWRHRRFPNMPFRSREHLPLCLLLLEMLTRNSLISLFFIVRSRPSCDMVPEQSHSQEVVLTYLAVLWHIALRYGILQRCPLDRSPRNMATVPANVPHVLPGFFRWWLG